MIATSPTLLITDDDRDFRETLQNVFEPRGFRTLLAGDGKEALDVVQSQDVHLLDHYRAHIIGAEAKCRLSDL